MPWGVADVEVDRVWFDLRGAEEEAKTGEVGGVVGVRIVVAVFEEPEVGAICT